MAQNCSTSRKRSLSPQDKDYKKNKVAHQKFQGRVHDAVSRAIKVAPQCAPLLLQCVPLGLLKLAMHNFFSSASPVLIKIKKYPRAFRQK